VEIFLLIARSTRLKMTGGVFYGKSGAIKSVLKYFLFYFFCKKILNPKRNLLFLKVRARKKYY
jgi:hypothetical protein